MLRTVGFVVPLQMLAQAGRLHSDDAVLFRAEVGTPPQRFHGNAVLFDGIGLVRKMPLADVLENLGEVRRAQEDSGGQYDLEFARSRCSLMIPEAIQIRPRADPAWY